MKPEKLGYKRILSDLLVHHGPMTTAQMVKLSGFEVSVIIGVIGRARNRHPGKCFRVVDYIYAPDSKKPVYVYADECGPDAPRPKVDPREKKPALAFASHGYLLPHEKLVIPEHERPYCTGTAQGRYTGQELSYRGSNAQC